MRKTKRSSVNKHTFYQKALEKKRGDNPFSPPHLSKKPRGQITANFASHDFLGLSGHPYVKKTIIKYALEWGTGLPPSHLETHHLESQQRVEDKLGKLIGKHRPLLFPSTYEMHTQILSTLATETTLIFIDQYSHYPLIEAAKSSRGRVFYFNHHNYDHLKELLEKNQTTHDPKIIISESLFGLDGETSDLKRLSLLAEAYDALLYIDDSNGVGVLGKHRMGLTSHRKGIDITTGSFENASRSFGAYVACPPLIREYLTTFNPGLLERTTLSPSTLGAISGVLDLIPDMHMEHQKIETHATYLRNALKKEGWDVGRGSMHLIPLISPIPPQTLYRTLSEKGISVAPLFPPIVPQEMTRLRLTVNALHTQDDLSLLLEALKRAPFLNAAP